MSFFVSKIQSSPRYFFDFKYPFQLYLENIKSILIQDKSLDLNHLQNDKNNDIFD